MVESGAGAPEGTSERRGALHDLAEHGVENEADIDPENGPAERGGSLAAVKGSRRMSSAPFIAVAPFRLSPRQSVNGVRDRVWC